MAAEGPPHKVRAPVALQRWHAISFLHWSYPAEVVQELMPAPLVVEPFDGRAWVGVTPFRMRDARLRGVPAVGPVRAAGTFPEVNVRTYVRGPDGPGLWFFTLEASNAVFCAAMRTLGLPYHWASMKIGGDPGCVSYRSRRRPPHASRATVEVAVDLGEVIPDRKIGDFENYLVSRWRAYHHVGPAWFSTRVEHEPWALRLGALHGDAAPLITACGLPAPEGQVLVHYSPGVDVRLAAPRRIS